MKYEWGSDIIGAICGNIEYDIDLNEAFVNVGVDEVGEFFGVQYGFRNGRINIISWEISEYLDPGVSCYRLYQNKYIVVTP